MRRIFTNPIMMVLMAIMMLFTVSCKKKNVKKIEVNNQLAVALFNGTITLKDIINDMDSTTSSWLRVRNDSIFAFYSDTVNGALSASSFLSDLEDTDFTTNTDFTLPPVDATHEKDTTIFSEDFTEIEFKFDGFDIEEVILREGLLTFGISITPEIPMLKGVEILSDQLVNPVDGQPLKINVEIGGDNNVVDLTGYKVRPDGNGMVAFSSNITLHYDPPIGFQGGNFTCNLVGGITNAKFKTVYAIVTKALDSTYSHEQEIDYGINGLNGISGNTVLPEPSVFITYKNTFGLNANCNVTRLDLYSPKPEVGYTSMIAGTEIPLSIEATNGAYRKFKVEGLAPGLDALAGYNRLFFDGALNMAMPGEHISISDTSRVDVIADIEMPLSFKINDLQYKDTVEVSFGTDETLQKYFDEIEFTIDYKSQIPVNVELQGVFLRHSHVIDSLFDNGGALLYNQPSIKSIKCKVTDDKLNNVMRANKMILRLRMSTRFDSSQPAQTVILKESDNLYLRMKMLTKTNEVNIDDIL